jgi:hypothetical protein
MAIIALMMTHFLANPDFDSLSLREDGSGI